MSDYERSQDLALEAEIAAQRGQIGPARSLFEQAASLLDGVRKRLPSDRVRTRSVFGKDVATLYLRANALDEAERTAHELLSQDWVDETCRSELRQLLSRVWNERQLSELGLEKAVDGLSLILRGGDILNGMAPAETADHATRSISNLLRRVAAWLNGEQFARRTGDIRDVCQGYRAFRCEPVLGSYRIDVYLMQQQSTLDHDPTAPRARPPADIIDKSVQLARLVQQEDGESLAAEVTDRKYRRAFVRLFQAMAPDGSAVSEVEFRRYGASREEALRLLPSTRRTATRLLDADGAAQGAGVQTETWIGKLRAVDLDVGKLRMKLPNGETRDVEVPEDMSDVIGLLLNKDVEATGYLKPPRTVTWALTEIKTRDTQTAVADE